MGYIYKITNTVTNKVYIGQTINDPEKRWLGHQHSIGTNRGCPALKASMEKHGIDKFKFEVLIVCFDSDLSKFEKEYIKKYESFGLKGYNLTHGGEEGGFFKGCKHSPEEVERIKERWKNWFSNPENIKKMSDRVKQRFQNPEVRKNHSEIMKKTAAKRKASNIILRSEDHKQKIRESLIRYYNNIELSDNIRIKHKENITKLLGKKISQYTLGGSFIKSYASIRQAVGENQYKSTSSIRLNLKGESKTAYGFIWKYSE
jgi:group I intron endonuclease